jgi:nucleoside-triphosphatase
LDAKHAGRTPGSSHAAPVLLLTGRPGSGKTTALRQVVAALGERAGGFYTQELRAGGRRTGFELVTLTGERTLLATRDRDTVLARPAPFGRYRVDLEAIEAVGVPALLEALERGQVIVVDEIGPMEILSPRFREAILRILDSEAAVVGAIMLRSQPFADRVKTHPRARVWTITIANRDELPGEILAELGRCSLCPPHSCP